MGEIHKFRRMMVADLGDDQKLFWKGVWYTIGSDSFVEDDVKCDGPKTGDLTEEEELWQLEEDIADFDKYQLEY
jgi:hypothetical protein